MGRKKQTKRKRIENFEQKTYKGMRLFIIIFEGVEDKEKTETWCEEESGRRGEIG